MFSLLGQWNITLLASVKENFEETWPEKAPSSHKNKGGAVRTNNQSKIIQNVYPLSVQVTQAELQSSGCLLGYRALWRRLRLSTNTPFSRYRCT